MLVGTLTGRTSVGRRLGLEPLTLYGLSATHAGAISAQCYALQRTLDRADFLNVTRDLRQVDVDQEVGERLVLEIAYTAGNIGVAFILGAREYVPCLVAQLTPSVAQLVLEMGVLAAPPRVRGSGGIVCL